MNNVVVFHCGDDVYSNILKEFLTCDTSRYEIFQSSSERLRKWRKLWIIIF